MKKVRVRKVKRRIHENMAVYSTLRDEIIAIQEMQRNMYLYMHTLFAALYAVGVQFGYMFFLLAFIVILPFQSKINAYSWSITRLSIYIRVFFEETRNDIHWESFQTYPQFMDTAQTKKMSPTGWIGNNSTLILGVLAWGSFIWGAVQDIYHIESQKEIIVNAALIILSIILLWLAFVLTREYHQKTDLETFKIFDAYKRALEAGHLPREYRLKQSDGFSKVQQREGDSKATAGK